VVEQPAAGERVHALDRDRLLARRQAQELLQEEAVRARGVVLQRGRRERARGELVARQRGAAVLDRVEEPVERQPVAQPAPTARAQRAGEVDLRAEQVVRRALRRLLVDVDQWRQQREIVLGVVDRVGGRLGRGPAEPRWRRRGGALRELFETGQGSLRRAQRFQ